MTQKQNTKTIEEKIQTIKNYLKIDLTYKIVNALILLGLYILVMLLFSKVYGK